jgi:hypothetical protein
LPPLPEFEGGNQLASSRTGIPQIKLEGGRVSLNLKAPSRGQDGRFAAPTDMKDLPVAGVGGAEKMVAGEMALISVANPVQAYHLQIAKDQNFNSLIMNHDYEALDEIDLTETIPPGVYWMRVSYVDLLGFEGKFNAPRQITIGKKRYP